MSRKSRSAARRLELPSAGESSPPPRSLPVWVDVAVVFAVALVLRGVHLWQMSGTLIYQVLISDPRQYDAWAQTIVGGDWIGKEVFYQTPLYPYLLAGLYRCFGHDYWVVRIAQALCGATACVFLSRAGAAWFDRRAGLVAGLMLAAFPPAIFFDGILQKASLDLLLMSALLWVLASVQDRPRGWRFGLAGVLVGATTLNRENAAVLAPILLGWLVWLSWPRRPWATVGWSAAFLVGIALVLVPVGARNYRVGGMFALTTSQLGPNFYIGNRAEANGTYDSLRPGRGDPRFEREDARQLAERAAGHELTPAEISRYWLHRAISDIGAAPGRWCSLLWRKWLWTFNGHELIDSESLYTHARYSRVLGLLSPVWHFGTLTPLALAGIWFTRRAYRRLAVLYLVILGMAAAVALFYVFARYRYPLAPALTLFAAAGGVTLVERVRSLQAWPIWETATGVALGLLGLVFCNVPVDLPRFDDDAVTLFNVGTELSGQGRLDDAVKLWRAAMKEDRRIPEVYHHLGRAMLARGQLDAAQQYFADGRQIDARQPMFPLNLALIAAQRGDETQARQLLVAAVRLDTVTLAAIPGLAADALRLGQPQGGIFLLRFLVEQLPQQLTPRVQLIAAYQATGDDRAAAVELRTALQLDPQNLKLRNSLAWLMATSRDRAVRDPQGALKLAEALCQETQMRQPTLLDTLAVAYAAAGQYAQAVETCRQALALNTDARLQGELAARLAQFEAGKPWGVPSDGAAGP
ncbi:MAG: glycosyltransferase family 39 protein [Pirellulales bacterium]|nr:glycosyltransferase family 39 protein [Pirellulales bacterium]